MNTQLIIEIEYFLKEAMNQTQTLNQIITSLSDDQVLKIYHKFKEVNNEIIKTKEDNKKIEKKLIALLPV